VSQYSLECEDVVWYKSCRFVLAIVSAWGYVFFYVLRIDLSMAIVCMVKDSSSTSRGVMIGANETFRNSHGHLLDTLTRSGHVTNYDTDWSTMTSFTSVQNGTKGGDGGGSCGAARLGAKTSPYTVSAAHYAI